MSPIPPQTAPFDKGLDSGVFGCLSAFYRVFHGKIIFNSMSPIPPQNAPFDKGLDSGVFGCLSAFYRVFPRKIIFNSMSPIPPQNAPFDKGWTRAFSGALVHFTGEKYILCLLTINHPNSGAVLLEILQRKRGFHSFSVYENLLQFFRF
ncbi:hypothetical protein AVEN_55922-1 [Araneus ventricosus]|uniref:Uncharacterized protein n=1 Tax=Araneus ventricosus TaxID=182803 RepID=A0A4Y2I4Y4_ARAVE|nr:hypothetical protein AVEN_55922-1 [Araneus ventricosus]